MADLTEAHRLAQARLGAQTVAAMRAIWPLLDHHALDATTTSWLTAALPIVTGQRTLSARLSAVYVAAHKVEVLGPGAELAPQLAATPDPRAVATSLIVTGPVSLKRAARRGTPIALALDHALAGSSAAAMRHALNGGRRTIVDTLRLDRDAVGWRRVTSGRACEFCSMLAGRGAVYREATADFEAHDGCSCSAEPVWAP